MSKTTTNVYENENGKRFFLTNWHEDRMTPIISRSALDAYENINGELCDKLNDLAESLRKGSDEMRARGFSEMTCDEIASCIHFILADYGYFHIETR